MNRFSSRATGSASENQVVMVVSVMVCFIRDSTRSQISAAEFMGNLLWSVVAGALPPFGGGGTIKSMDK